MSRSFVVTGGARGVGARDRRATEPGRRCRGRGQGRGRRTGGRHRSEVAEVVAHLLSPAASFVDGAVIPVDGGRAALGVDPEAREV